MPLTIDWPAAGLGDAANAHTSAPTKLLPPF